ncbi:MAG: Polysaccharide deacetylase [candidate division TM6 bacterium GW2011_GWE2_42_60]|nr:MAG: Polysaccharide deacetylase [candidate division TM6 bacterium GW2011_GWE2_42_60]
MKKTSTIALLASVCFFGMQAVELLFEQETYEKLKAKIVTQFEGKVPYEWSETATGVVSTLGTSDKVIALTCDACGSKTDGYDKELIDFLIKENVPATLFINARWIDKNPTIFKELAANPLFEIESHGMEHKPCSVNGNSIYGLQGTKSPAEVVDEVEKNGLKIALLTGRKPKYYRSGTAFYDEVAVQIVSELGYKVIGFSVLGDKGATLNANEVEKAFLTSENGSIIICHFNRPEKETGAGLRRAIPKLKEKGFTFVKLEEYLSPTSLAT